MVYLIFSRYLPLRITSRHLQFSIVSTDEFEHQQVLLYSKDERPLVREVAKNEDCGRDVNEAPDPNMAVPHNTKS